MGIVIGAILLPIAMIVFAEEYDLVLSAMLLYGVLIGAVAGCLIGAIIGLAIRAWFSFSRGARPRALPTEVHRQTRGDEPRG